MHLQNCLQNAIPETVYEPRTCSPVTLKNILYYQLRNQELFWNTIKKKVSIYIYIYIFQMHFQKWLGRFRCHYHHNIIISPFCEWQWRRKSSSQCYVWIEGTIKFALELGPFISLNYQQFVLIYFLVTFINFVEF